MGGASADSEGGIDPHNVLLLGRLGSPKKPDDEERSHHLSVPAKSSRGPEDGVHRAEDGHGRSVDVRQGGPHYPADQHFLRLHRNQGDP